MDAAQHIFALQNVIAQFYKQNVDQLVRIRELENATAQMFQYIGELGAANITGALSLLATKKIMPEIRQQNLPPQQPFITVSIDWVEGMEKYLPFLGYGRLVQPLPDFRPESMVTTLSFDTVEELEKLYPDRLKKSFPNGGWAQLEVPLELKWSKTTQKLSATFTYSSYLKSGFKSTLYLIFQVIPF